MPVNQPFEDPKVAGRYESWYSAEGQKAVKDEKSLIRHLLNAFPGVQSILEVGCGTGYFSEWLSALGYSVVGLDHSRMMLSEAAAHHHDDHLDWVQGDILDLPILDLSFDLVVMITTLEFVDDPLRAISEVLRVARQGMILGVINRHSLVGWRYQRKGGPIWGSASLYTKRSLLQLVSHFVSQADRMDCRTTLFPCVSIISKLLWGGFIGLSVKFA